MIYQKSLHCYKIQFIILFFWHQLQDVLVMHGQSRTISNGYVKIVLRRIGI